MSALFCSHSFPFVCFLRWLCLCCCCCYRYLFCFSRLVDKWPGIEFDVGNNTEATVTRFFPRAEGRFFTLSFFFLHTIAFEVVQQYAASSPTSSVYVFWIRFWALKSNDWCEPIKHIPRIYKSVYFDCVPWNHREPFFPSFPMPPRFFRFFFLLLFQCDSKKSMVLFRFACLFLPLWYLSFVDICSSFFFKHV